MSRNFPLDIGQVLPETPTFQKTPALTQGNTIRFDMAAALESDARVKAFIGRVVFGTAWTVAMLLALSHEPAQSTETSMTGAPTVQMKGTSTVQSVADVNPTRERVWNYIAELTEQDKEWMRHLLTLRKTMLEYCNTDKQKEDLNKAIKGMWDFRNKVNSKEYKSSQESLFRLQIELKMPAEIIHGSATLQNDQDLENIPSTLKPKRVARPMT